MKIQETILGWNEEKSWYRRNCEESKHHNFLWRFSKAEFLISASRLHVASLAEVIQGIAIWGKTILKTIFNMYNVFIYKILFSSQLVFLGNVLLSQIPWAHHFIMLSFPPCVSNKDFSIYRVQHWSNAKEGINWGIQEVKADLLCARVRMVINIHKEVERAPSFHTWWLAAMIQMELRHRNSRKFQMKWSAVPTDMI